MCVIIVDVQLDVPVFLVSLFFPAQTYAFDAVQGFLFKTIGDWAPCERARAI